MQYLLGFVLAVIVWLPCSVFAQEEKLTEEELASIQLPMDPEDPVFEFDSFGGMRMAVPKDFKATPGLRVYGDGKVVAGSSRPSVKVCTQMISEEQLNQFLHYVANKQKFYEMTTEDLNQKMADSGQQIMLADAPTSRFSINLQRGANSVEIYALNFVVRKFIEIEEFRNLFEIEKRCRKMIAVCRLGNELQTQRLLEELNSALKAKHPDLAPFAAADVRYATRYVDGKFEASFRKIYDADGDRPTRVVNVRINRQTDDDPSEITVSDVKEVGQPK